LSELELKILPHRRYYSHAKITVGVVDVHLIFDNDKEYALTYVLSSVMGKTKPIELCRAFLWKGEIFE